MIHDWKIEDFSATEINTKITNRTFEVPTYQRGLVWSNKQREDLVDTIKKGLPFGTLLLYKKDDGRYQIIDGLQRSYAIIKFVTQPTQFFNEDDIDPDVIHKIFGLMGVNTNARIVEDEVKKVLIDWVQSYKSLEDVKGMQFADFAMLLGDKYPTCKNKIREIGNLIKPMMRNYQEICEKISSTRIPAIVLSGSEEYLPVLFERINSKGTQLSKYQIYAATWNSTKYTLDNEYTDIVKYNRDRYDMMLDGTMNLDDYDSTTFLKERQLNAFELCFGIGKYLCNKWPHLFGMSKEDKQVESIGFTIVNGCLGQKNKDVKFLNTILNKKMGQEHINDFLKEIFDAVSITDKALGKFNTFKSNSRSNAGKKPLHTEFQIASIITSVFLMKYADIELDDNEKIKDISFCHNHQKKSWKKTDLKNFKTNVAKIYMMEIFQKRWSGTGDRKMDMVLTNPQYYTKTISKEEFGSALTTWFETMNTERQEFKRIAQPKEQELLFLAALYLPSFSAGQQVDASNYDIEHLATRNLMKKKLDRFDAELRLPISSIGNLCLLPQYANRSKQDKTIYSDTAYLKKSNLSLKEVEDQYTFTTENDLAWLEDDSLTKEQFEYAYMRFIENHFNRMKERLLDHFDNL